jgi:hypothetical protein
MARYRRRSDERVVPGKLLEGVLHHVFGGGHVTDHRHGSLTRSSSCAWNGQAGALVNFLPPFARLFSWYQQSWLTVTAAMLLSPVWRVRVSGS